MDKGKALELLKQYLQEVPSLAQLRYGAHEYELWESKVEDVLRAAFGENSRECKEFMPLRLTGYPYYEGSTRDAWFEKWYLENLSHLETQLKKILQRDEIVGIDGERHVTRVPLLPKAFIAHGGETAARNKVQEFLEALGVAPIIAEKEPTESRSVDQQVEWCLDKSDCAIILATRGDVNGHTGEFIPRGNILIELGRCQERFPDRTIYLLEENTRFPSNIDEKLWARFTQDNMEQAFLKIVRELVAFRFIRAEKGG